MNIYEDVLTATVVSHSITGHFTSTSQRELIIVRTNIISVYNTTDDGKLNLVEEFNLNAKITDIALIPQEKSPLSCLVIASGVAKISIVRFDAVTNSLETLSLHYYEDKLSDISLVTLAKTSKLRVDPMNRALLLFNNDSIALLPLFSGNHEDEDEDDEEDDYDVTRGEVTTKRSKKNEKHVGQSKIFHVKELHQELQNVLDIQFLNDFTKPTLAVLYQPKLTWVGNTELNPQPTSFMIFTLNLRTNELETAFDVVIIATLHDLSWDWFQLLPISRGCVVMGNNEMAYIDNTGVLQSIIHLNSFADKSLQRARIIDETELEVFFNEKVTYFWSASTDKKNIDDETLLIIDASANLYYVRLEAEGRLLTKFDLIKLPIVNDALKDTSNPTCVARVDPNSSNSSMDLFIGYLSGDSLVVRLNNLKSAIETREEHKESKQIFTGYDDDDDDEDNLYSDDESKEKIDEELPDNKQLIQTVQPFDIEQLTSLRNIGPITSLVAGKVTSVDPNVKGLQNPNSNEYSMVATSGSGTGSHLTAIQPSVQPLVELALKFISVTQIWKLKMKNKDKYLVTTDSTKSKSDIYEIDNKFALHKEGRLRRDATTIHISMFGEGTRIVQVTTNHLYLFDTDFRRLTAIKFDFEVVHVSVMDPYILITVLRGDIKIYELDALQKRKLFRVDLPEILKEMVVTSGVILKSNMCNEYLHGHEDSEEEQLLFTFVTADNQIIFFLREHNDRIFQLCGVDQLKEGLFISTYQLPEEVVPDPSIKQVMINKLGHNNKEEYLTILTFGGEIYQYKKSRTRHSCFFKNTGSTGMCITGAPDNAYAKGVSSIERIMHYIPDYSEYSVIFLTGSVPYIIMREDDSSPKIFRFANLSIVSLAQWGKNSVMAVDDIKNARVYSLDNKDSYYGNSLPLKKIKISDSLEDFMTLTKITYHEKSQLFLVSYAKEREYEALGEDGEIIVGSNDQVPHAKSFQSGILLINPRTWNVIDRVDFEVNSIISDMRSMLIQLDSKSRKKREYIVAGITFIGTEDLPSTGAFHIYDLTEVIPEPGKPDTNFKLKEIFKEDIRGSVNSVCDISGRFLINQSQKIMVRDVQEDNSVVPVAFYDTPIFVSDAKSFGNFLILGDSMQGFQFLGFDAEPYRMIPLGRSVSSFETVSVEFLINAGEINFAITDREDILHVLKYAPDEPNTLSGQKLVHCSSFNLYSSNTCMLMLPRNDEFETSDKAPPKFQAIGGQVDGGIFKIIPLKEDTYRRLYVVQQQIIDKEVQLGGLNPRMERLDNDFYQLTHVMRPMIDFNIIRRFSELSIERRTHFAQKAGRRAHFDIWRDIINVEYSLRSLCGSK